MTVNLDAGLPGGAYLTADEEERLVDRLYTQSLTQKEAKLAELDSRYYPVAAPRTISEEAIQKSVKRQVDDEMELRRQRRALLDATAAGNTGGARGAAVSGSETKLSHEAVEASVHRLYDETLARQKANMAESQKRYAFHPETVKGKRMAKEAVQSSVERMSKPKKTEYSIAEVNKIYGL